MSWLGSLSGNVLFLISVSEEGGVEEGGVGLHFSFAVVCELAFSSPAAWECLPPGCWNRHLSYSNVDFWFDNKIC